MGAAESLPRRCATYTRKSSEEGLEQDFNSLDAQREACEAYIRSQAGEGWRPVPTHYDDGGFSGGTLERPALARLLADIEAGEIDTVVVYKVDRLTRSLADFAKIVEVFDAQQVSFVSVTQQFNTTTSMGRLTLNMLLSFAQFEREVTGERIRDKIAASKRKGLWMGGPVPLGYEPEGRTLVICEPEAETVRTLFRLYLELGSVRKLQAEAGRLGLRSKVRPNGNEARMRGGRSLSRGYLYHLLANPLYVGRIPHNGSSYPGQHPAIVDIETWEAVQKRLAAQTPVRSVPSGARPSSPLRGKLFDASGAPLTPSRTVKSGKRYRYYVSQALLTGNQESSKTPSSRWRLPAREIERLVTDAVTTLLADPPAWVDLARGAGVPESRLSDLLEAVRHWSGSPLDLVQRVELYPEQITLEIDLGRFQDRQGGVVRHVVPVCVRKRGVELRLVVERDVNGSSGSHLDPTLIKAVVRGRAWFEDLASGRVRSLIEIARTEGVTDRYVGQLIPLAFLDPEIVSAILGGTQPVELTTERLLKGSDLPLHWTRQRELLGFGQES